VDRGPAGWRAVVAAAPLCAGWCSYRAWGRTAAPFTRAGYAAADARRYWLREGRGWARPDSAVCCGWAALTFSVWRAACAAWRQWQHWDGSTAASAGESTLLAPTGLWLLARWRTQQRKVHVHWRSVLTERMWVGGVGTVQGDFAGVRRVERPGEEGDLRPVRGGCSQGGYGRWRRWRWQPL
jgi:hypothetical protein